MKKVLVTLGILLAVGCGNRQVKPVEPNDTNMCAAACEHMAEMSCPEGAPLPDGTSCQVFCEETQEKGHALNPTCLAAIKSCEDVNMICAVNRRGSW